MNNHELATELKNQIKKNPEVLISKSFVGMSRTSTREPWECNNPSESDNYCYCPIGLAFKILGYTPQAIYDLVHECWGLRMKFLETGISLAEEEVSAVIKVTDSWGEEVGLKELIRCLEYDPISFPDQPIKMSPEEAAIWDKWAHAFE